MAGVLRQVVEILRVEVAVRAVAPGRPPPSGGLELPAGRRPPQPKGGEPGRVDRSGQELEVLGHAHQPSDPGAAAAVAAAQQVGELAFDLGRVARSSARQAGSRWRARAAANSASWGWMATTRPAMAPVQAWRSGHTLHARPNLARPPPPRDGAIATVTRAGQVTVPAARSIRNWSLPNRPPDAVAGWVLTIGVSRWASSQARWAPVP